MAQNGFTPISIYYSTTASAVPTAANLVQGELAINTNDGKLYYEDSSGVVRVLATKGGVGTSSNTQVLYNSSGLVVGDADFTFNGTTVTMANDASVNGLTVGRGTSAISTNTALGVTALLGINSGVGFNTAIGYQALKANTSGVENTAVGGNAGLANTSGSYNSIFGTASFVSNLSGASNTGVGHNTLGTNTTGSSNTAIGRDALQANLTASNNTAVGYQAGYSNTTGTLNAFFGTTAGYTNNTGSYCTYIGRAAGYNSTGSSNTFVGHVAGYNSTGSGNTFVGINSITSYGAGFAMTSGSDNTILGGYDGNQGGLDIRTASNYIVLSDGDGNPRAYLNDSGQPFFPSTRGSAGTYAARFTGFLELTVDTSSARYKDNIRDSIYGLADLLKIQSRQFEYKDDGRSDVGFIAEEMVEVIPEVVAIDKQGRPDAVSYDRLVSVCVKAIQELKAEFDAYKATHP
jgi:hypothetical protein